MKPRKLPELKPLFLERMQKIFTDKKDFQEYLDILKIPPVKSIRCNTLKISPDKLKKRLEEKAWKISQPYKDYPEIMIVEGKIAEAEASEIETDNKESFVNKPLTSDSERSLWGGERFREIASKQKRAGSGVRRGRGGLIKTLADLEPGELGRAIEHLLGYYYIQELASMLPIIALSPKQNELILDIASAPGSKTTQLAAVMKNTGSIIANEISMGRLKILASNLERCGVTNTIITRKDGIAFSKRILKYNPELKFDCILIDAPCSGEGTLRSSPKTYVMWNIKTVKNLPKIQKQLITNALDILKPNGTIIYSTCTHAPEENEGVIDSVLKEAKGKIKLEKINLPIKCREGLTEWDYRDSSSVNKSREGGGERLREIASKHRRARSGVLGKQRGDFQEESNKKIMKFSPEIKKCARIYPQDNNTEGFFIAKLRKVK